MKLAEIAPQHDQLDEMSLQRLEANTDQAFPSRDSDANNVRIKQKQYLKYDSDKLMIKAICDGETSDYETSIMFQSVIFTTPNDPQSIKLNDLHIQPLSTSKDVQTSCTCEDFKWTFAWYNASTDSLIGDPPPPYQRTTDRAPRNPKKVPGLCKHLKKLVDDLQAEQTFV